MEYSIDWQKLNGDSFQELCNHLLHFDVSKEVEVFTAPGKDDGIDAQLKGVIDGTKVWWRFQAKYHSPSAKSAQSDFKRQVAKDVAKNWKGEERIIFLTSIEIGPIAKDKIIEDAINGIEVNDNPAPEILIWDKAELEVRLTKHPIVLQRFWGNQGATLIPYKDRFARQLAPENEEPFFFNKPFWGRKEELQQLADFLDKDEETLRCIVGAGGYGKTRLCINFFQTVVDPHALFNGFVLVSRSFNAAAFEFILRGLDKLVVLVDDAHNETCIQAIVQIASRSEFKGKIKLLLTTRTSLFPQLSELFPAYDQLKADIKVGALSQEDSFKGVEEMLGETWKAQFEEAKRMDLYYPLPECSEFDRRDAIVDHDGSSRGSFRWRH